MGETPSIMEAFTTAVSNFWDIVGTSWTEVTANAVWTVPLAIPLVGSGVAMVKRLVKPGSGRRRG